MEGPIHERRGWCFDRSSTVQLLSLFIIIATITCIIIIITITIIIQTCTM